MAEFAYNELPARMEKFREGELVDSNSHMEETIQKPENSMTNIVFLSIMHPLTFEHFYNEWMLLNKQSVANFHFFLYDYS